MLFLLDTRNLALAHQAYTNPEIVPIVTLLKLSCEKSSLIRVKVPFRITKENST